MKRIERMRQDERVEDSRRLVLVEARHLDIREWRQDLPGSRHLSVP